MVFFFLEALGIGPRTSHMLPKCPNTVTPQPNALETMVHKMGLLIRYWWLQMCSKSYSQEEKQVQDSEAFR